MSTFKKLEDIEVWKRRCRLAVSIYQFTASISFDKFWALREQILKSAVPIPSIIAEGYERDSSTEFKRFLLIAKGSCAELRTQLYIIKALYVFDPEQVIYFINECMEIASMLQSMIRYLKTLKKK